MVLDIHAHCFPDQLALKAVPILAERAGIKAYADGTVDGLKKSMHHAGIDVSVLQPIATRPEHTAGVNRWAVEVQTVNIISFGTIHPDFPDWKEEIEWLAGAGVKGVKFHPDYQNFFVDEARLFPVYEALAESGFIMLFHAGTDIGLPDPCHCTPLGLKKVADAFPGAKIIAAHMGGYQHWENVEKYLAGREIYLDTSYSFNDLGPEGMENMIKAHGVEKILFGTDTPWTDPSAEIAKINSLNLSRREIDGILYHNAKSLLCLE